MSGSYQTAHWPPCTTNEETHACQQKQLEQIFVYVDLSTSNSQISSLRRSSTFALSFVGNWDSCGYISFPDKTCLPQVLFAERNLPTVKRSQKSSPVPPLRLAETSALVSSPPKCDRGAGQCTRRHIQQTPSAAMGNALGTKKTLKEQLRENKREINRAVRQLDRERTNLQLQEKKLIIEIKKMAKQGQIASVKIMAKDLVRTRQHITKFYTMRSQLQAVSLRLETAKSAEAMTSALQGTTTAMKAMASTMNLPRLNQIMMEYTKESEKMEMTQEMIGDTIDDVMDADQDEEEEDKIVGQVLDEIGIDMTGAVPEAPTAHAAPAAAAAQAAPAAALPPAAPVAAGGGDATDSAISDLEARLNNLRRS
ncbi:unnamed protein product [Phytophthora lilii]|uniref:Unnamed protein product n=1 Tax=Phytophthora lilii TaxID=2077276 RepID=A0A9W6U6D9_9STRA|nr:unnamed protein product [Phytophthora lilii]